MERLTGRTKRIQGRYAYIATSEVKRTWVRKTDTIS
jgi:hypothetical protein